MNANANIDGTKRKTNENKTKQQKQKKVKKKKSLDFKSIDRKNELISSDVVVHYMYYTWCNRCVVSLNVKCAFIHSEHSQFIRNLNINTICYWILLLLLHEIHEEKYTISI